MCATTQSELSFRTPLPGLDKLTPAQREAVVHLAGPQLIVAGAGTGKTSVITSKIVYIIEKKIARPDQILALTFTEKAAREMEERVDRMLPLGFMDTAIKTFHGFAEMLLRDYAILLGINPNYRLLTHLEQMLFLKQHVFALPLSIFRPLSDPARHLDFIIRHLSRVKDEGIEPETYLAFAENASHSPEMTSAERQKHLEMARVYQAYSNLSLQKGVMDFGDLLRYALRLLREHPDCAERLRRQYTCVLVDEFQDTNFIQFQLLLQLLGPTSRLAVVGDDDQSIYKFRGAAISNILHFQKSFPNVTVSVLTENFRSTQPILDAAYRLIRNNDPERLETKHAIVKKLISRTGPGDPPLLKSFHTLEEESEWVAESIAELIRSGVAPGAIAILVRANHHAQAFYQALCRKGIPASFPGVRRFYRQPSVRLCIAFLECLAEPDNTLAFYDLLSSEAYALPGNDLVTMIAASRKSMLPIGKTLEFILGNQPETISPEAMVIARTFLDDLAKHTREIHSQTSGRILYAFLSDKMLFQRWLQESSPASERKIRDVAALFKTIGAYETLYPDQKLLFFIEYLHLLEEYGEDPPDEEDQNEETVSMLTVHRAKGLEFDHVYLVNLSEQRFPGSPRAKILDVPDALLAEEVPAEEAHIPEERRLFYVALTRAKKTCTLTFSDFYGGSKRYKPSRFIREALGDIEAPPSRKSASQLEITEPAAVPAGKMAELKITTAQALTLSFKQLDDYLTCPKKYHFSHHLKLPVPPHCNLTYGSALHQTVAEYFRRRKLGRSVSHEELLEIVRSYWSNQGYLTREHAQERYQCAEKALLRFWESAQKENLLPEAIEKPFEFLLAPHRIVGRMDRFDRLPDGKIRIVDYKTSEVADQAAADKKMRESLQLRLYALAFKNMEGRLPDEIGLYFLESGIYASCAPLPEKISETESLIFEVAGKIQGQEFAAAPSAWICRYCPFHTICQDAETA